MHEGSKPYFCDLCGSAYTNSQALVEHKVKIHNLLLYKCSLCTEEFPQKKYLIEHLVKCHEGEKVEIRTKKLPFQCPICEVCYTKKELLDSHLAENHEGEAIPKTKLKKIKVKKDLLVKRSKKSKVKTENPDYNEFDDFYDPNLDFKQEIITEDLPESIDGFHSNISVKEEWNPTQENSEGFLEDYEDIPEEDYEISEGFIEEYHENPGGNPEGFLEDYEDIPEDYDKNPKGFQEEYEENPMGMSWENSETKEGVQDVDFKMCQPKKELFQDYTDPLAVCDVKLDNKEIESDYKSDTTKNGNDTKIKTKKKKKPSKVGPKQCTVCGKTFKDKSSLTQHTKFVHEKAKTELCPECGKSFMKKDNLMR